MVPPTVPVLGSKETGQKAVKSTKVKRTTTIPQISLNLDRKRLTNRGWIADGSRRCNRRSKKSNNKKGSRSDDWDDDPSSSSSSSSSDSDSSDSGYDSWTDSDDGSSRDSTYKGKKKARRSTKRKNIRRPTANRGASPVPTAQSTPYNTIRQLRSAASQFLTLDAISTRPSGAFFTRDKNILYQDCRPTDGSAFTLFTNGMKSRVEDEPVPSMALLDRHMRILDQELEQLYQRAVSFAQRRDAAMAGLAKD